MQFMVMSFSDKDNFAKLWNFQNLTYGGQTENSYLLKVFASDLV